MDSFWVTGLLTIIGPTLGAAAAAYLGVRVAHARYSGERAFDRRLAWYEQATRALQTYGASLHLLTVATSKGWEDERVSSLVDDMIGEREKLNDVVLTAALYGKPAAVVEVLRLTEMMYREVYPIPATGPQGEPGYKIDVRGIRMVADQCSKVAAELTDELRDHLGLEALKPDVLRRLWSSHDVPGAQQE